MDANMKKRNELLAKTVIKGLESRNMSGYYAQDKEAALKQEIEKFQFKAVCIINVLQVLFIVLLRTINRDFHKTFLQ